MPFRLLTHPTSLLLYHASTAGAEVGAVAEVNAAADTARRLVTRPPPERVLRPSTGLANLFGPNPGRRVGRAPHQLVRSSRSSVIAEEGEQVDAPQMMDGGSR
jgi:hypothetical protein